MEQKGIIYRAYLPSGISYIGQTVDFEKRKKRHYYTRKNGSPFHNAILLFGWESVQWEQLETGVPINEMNNRERYWISFYDSCENGLNETPGGCCCRSKEYYEHLSKALSGRVLDDETKMKISNSHKGAPHPHKGQLGRTAWNKGLTKDTDKRVAAYAKTRWG